MYRFGFAVAVMVAMSLAADKLYAQGATQAVRGVAQGLQDKVAEGQGALTTGPKDTREKRSPGAIDANASREFTTTKSGLKYRILRKTNGKKPQATDRVEVDYKGWLDDGKIFDSSYRTSKPASFPLNRVIKGWTEGVALVGVGGMIELIIPPELGYGERGTPGGPIPPGAQLHFIVELVSIP